MSDSTILDFVPLPTYNVNTIGIADISHYASGFTIVNPTFEITPPGFNKATLPYNTGTLNIFNSNNLNLTCVTDPALLAPLPDGIWTVTMSLNPVDQYTKTKTFLRTDKIQQSFGNLFLKTDITQCNRDVKRQQMTMIDEISYYLNGAIAAANDCNMQLSMSLYKGAATMINDALNNKSNFYLNNPNYYLYGG